MALLVSSVFGVTGCGSDDDEAPVESRIKNSTGYDDDDIQGAPRDINSKDLDERLDINKHLRGNDFIVNRPPLKEGVYEVPKSGGSMNRDELDPFHWSPRVFLKQLD